MADNEHYTSKWWKLIAKWKSGNARVYQVENAAQSMIFIWREYELRQQTNYSLSHAAIFGVGFSRSEIVIIKYGICNTIGMSIIIIS
jgi:hypothetical protein